MLNSYPYFSTKQPIKWNEYDVCWKNKQLRLLAKIKIHIIGTYNTSSFLKHISSHFSYSQNSLKQFWHSFMILSKRHGVSTCINWKAFRFDPARPKVWPHDINRMMFCIFYSVYLYNFQQQNNCFKKISTLLGSQLYFIWIH